MTDIVISGTGLYTPADSISNAELVESFNAYVDIYNADHADAIEAGDLPALQHSSVEFIEKASGIKSRYVVNKEGILDPQRMAPRMPERPNDEQSVQCEMAVAAAREAMAQAGKSGQRYRRCYRCRLQYATRLPGHGGRDPGRPGHKGFRFRHECGLLFRHLRHTAGARCRMPMAAPACVLMLNPEICSGHLNFRDRDSHFIFGDVCTAIIVERADTATCDDQYLIVDSKLQTIYSNNIRNNFGFLNRGDESGIGSADKLFVQEGRKVFKEVCPAVAAQISEQLETLAIAPPQLKRIWLHQANLSMNQLIAKRVLGREASDGGSTHHPRRICQYQLGRLRHRLPQAPRRFRSGDVGVLVLLWRRLQYRLASCWKKR